MLIDISPERSASLDELLLIEASIDEASVLAVLMVETLGVELGPPESQIWRDCIEESDDAYPIPIPVGRYKLRGNRSLVSGGVTGLSSADSSFELCHLHKPRKKE